MSEEHIKVITDREKLYDKCENMEQLFDKYYLPLLIKHYDKTYKLQQENSQLKDRINKAAERLTLNGDIKEENVIEVLTNAIKDTRDLLKGDKE